MAQLLFSWLNDEVKLSQMVTNLEEDFRDGYLLGELLFRFNQQDNFLMFDRTFTPDSRIKNFCLLEPTIRRLGAPFNFALAFDIMKGKQGVTKALLAELRAILERIKKNSMPPIAPPGQRGQIMRVMRPGNERFDKSMSQAFEKSVRALMDNPTEVILHKTVTAKFEAIGEASDALAESGDNQDQWEVANEQLRKREVFEHRKKHEGEFKKSWDLMNVEQWKRNQQTGRTRKMKEDKEVTDYQTRRAVHFTTINENARAETFSSINAFDKRLQKEVFREDAALASGLGASLKKTVSAADGSGLPTLEYTDQAYLDAGLNLALKTMKEHHSVELQKQQVHDRRRRKFVRQQERTHSTNLHTRAQSEIVEQLLNESKSEAIETTSRDKVLAHREIFAENRILRQERVLEVDATTSQALDARSKEICTREKDWVVAAQRDSLHARVGMLDEAKSSAASRRALEFAAETVDRILSLVDWVVTERHVGLFHEPVPVKKLKEGADAEASEAFAAAQAKRETKEADALANPLQMNLLPASMWNDAKEMFTSSLDMAEAIMKPDETNVYTEEPYSLCERPKCVDFDWLLSKSFQTHSQFAPAGSLEREVADLIASMEAEKAAVEAAAAPAAEAEAPAEAAAPAEGKGEAPVAAAEVKTTAAVVTVLPLGSVADADRLVSEHLATVDANAFVASVATADIEGYAEPVEAAALPTENVSCDVTTAGYDKDLIVSPDFLYTTPPKFLLGQVLVATSCAAVPLSADPPTPVHVLALPLRASLCGVSAVCRAAVSAALKAKMPDLALISSEELVHGATQLATDTLLAESLGTAETERTAEQSLALEVLGELQAGNAISDRLYVALVVQRIGQVLPPKKPLLNDREVRDKAEADAKKTEKILAAEKVEEEAAAAEQVRKYPGFLLEDFPCTKEQSVLLFQALSGIKYDEKRPSAGERASHFSSALPDTYDPCSYDSSKCGLNKVIYLDQSDLLSLTDERVRSRRNLQNGEIVLLEEETQSIDTLEELYTPLRPVQTTSVEYSQTDAVKDPLMKFLSSMGILSSYSVGPWDGDYKTREEAISAVLSEVSSLTNLFVVGDDVVEVVSEEAVPVSKEVLAEASTEEAPAAEETTPVEPAAEPTSEEEVTKVVKMSSPKAALLEQPVAAFLMGMWKDAERQSMHSTRSYFAAMRDVRYQMVQRRRGVHDVIQRFIIQRDDRQNIFEEFSDRFNMLDDAFRFDFGVMGELYCRNLELARQLWLLSDNKREQILSALKSISRDGMTSVFIHRCQAEGAALMQAEFKRFLVALHVLFDFTKGSAAFNGSKVMRNTLEACLEPVVPSLETATEAPAGGKDAKKPADKGKKGEVAAAVAWRQVVPPVLLPSMMMKALPEKPAAVEEVVDPKAKKAPPPKKGAVEEVPANPLDTMAAAVAAALADWSKGTFTVQRAVYSGQEALCASLEAAVWHEAERCKFSIDAIKTRVNAQTVWVSEMEEDMLSVMEGMVHARHSKEIQVTHRLTEMIAKVIQNADRLNDVWVIDGDAITVFTNKSKYPAVETADVPQPLRKFDNVLNSEQLNNFAGWLETVKTGSVVLEQDVVKMLTQAQSAVNPKSNQKQASVQLDAGVRRIGSSSSGELTVNLVSAHDLINSDAERKSDPYAILRIQDSVYQSKKIENDLNPKFEEKFTVAWNGVNAVEIHIFDHDQFKPHQLIGYALVDLSVYKEKLEAGEEVVIEKFPLKLSEEADAKELGSVTIGVTVPQPKLHKKSSSCLVNFALPPHWRTPSVFQKLLEALLPVARVTGVDESVGYVDAEQLLASLRDFNSDSV